MPPVPEISAAISRHAEFNKLDPKLVAAIVWQESQGNKWAHRREPHFYDLHLAVKERNDLSGFLPPPGTPSLQQEKWDRADSYGLMQIMGETARDVGFSGLYLTELLDTDCNLAWGCKFLRGLFEKVHAHSIQTGVSMLPDQELGHVLTLWNGSTQYPAKIREHLASGSYREIWDEQQAGTG